MKELVLYRCNICGNLICMIEDSGVVPQCCGEEMTRETANQTDASVEKHVPACKRDGLHVQIMIGSSPHPMTENHHIEWILLLTTHGIYVRNVGKNSEAVADFQIRADEAAVAVYAYCNLHGLWMKKM